MSDAYKHIRSARKSANLTQESIAKACGVSRNAVTQWESRNPATRTEPSIDNLKIISTLTDSPISKLIGLEPVTSQVQEPQSSYQPTRDHQKIPVISWQQAYSLSAPDDIHRLPTAKQLLNKVIGGNNTYALPIKDNSMVSTGNSTPTFPIGFFIHIDPDQPSQRNDFVLARIKGQTHLTFKQLAQSHGKLFLQSLAEPNLSEDEEFIIVGKVIAVGLEL